MQIILVSCLLAVAFGAPQQVADRDRLAVITQDERFDQGDGNFGYSFAADNGLQMEVSGTPGSQGQSDMQGSFLLPTADGGFAVVNFVANEFGYQPQSDLLPVGPAAPPHVAELLRIADEQRAAGITFD